MFGKWFEIIKLSLYTVKLNRRRLLLTSLSIIIGVASMIVVGAIGRGGERLISKEMLTIGGLTSMWVRIAEVDEHPLKRIRTDAGFTTKDISAITTEIPFVQLISPVSIEMDVWAQYEDRYAKVILTGVGAEYYQIYNYEIIGRPLERIDIRGRHRVCIIREEIKERLFGKGIDPIGKKILLGGNRYSVVGVIKKRDTPLLDIVGLTGGSDKIVTIPITLFQSQIGRKNIDRLDLKIDSVSNVEETGRQIEELLTRCHQGQYGYNIETGKGYYSELTRNVVRIASIVAIIVFLASMIGGGIGITNVMALSVTERTREIGIRKAVGARERDILLQFLTEAVLISLGASIIGSILGIGITLIIEALTNFFELLIWEIVVIAFGISVMIGIFSGLFPANRAAKLRPVDALRYE